MWSWLLALRNASAPYLPKNTEKVKVINVSIFKVDEKAFTGQVQQVHLLYGSQLCGESGLEFFRMDSFRYLTAKTCMLHFFMNKSLKYIGHILIKTIYLLDTVQSHFNSRKGSVNHLMALLWSSHSNGTIYQRSVKYKKQDALNGNCQPLLMVVLYRRLYD